MSCSCEKRYQALPAFLYYASDGKLGGPGNEAGRGVGLEQNNQRIEVVASGRLASFLLHACTTSEHGSLRTRLILVGMITGEEREKEDTEVGVR